MPDEGASGAEPRILVTGFSVFPGAPVNPTEALVRVLGERWRGEGRRDRLAVCLDVDYRAVPARLQEIGRAFSPDIAVHFGLSARAVGFTLERRARNTVSCERGDVHGFAPSDFIIGEADTYASSLPLATIEAALEALGLPTAYSDDAGDYLCNYLFYLSRCGAANGFRPLMSGFVHVPPVANGAMSGSRGFSEADLIAGAGAVVEACRSGWSGLGK